MSYHCLFEPIETKTNYSFSVQPAKTVGDRPQQGDRPDQSAEHVLGIEVGGDPRAFESRRLRSVSERMITLMVKSTKAGLSKRQDQFWRRRDPCIVAKVDISVPRQLSQTMLL